jgi:hypothetical protein
MNFHDDKNHADRSIKIEKKYQMQNGLKTTHKWFVFVLSKYATTQNFCISAFV